MISFLVIGCGQTQKPDASDESQANTSKEAQSSQTANSSSNGGKSSNAPSSKPSSSNSHVHEWGTEWEYDDNNHWHACSGCNEKNGNAAHTLGAAQTMNLGEYLNDEEYKRSTITFQKCTVCDYIKLDTSKAVLPEVRFNFNATNSSGEAQVMDFATIARSNDLTRPTVEGTVSITNAGDYNTKADLPAVAKVRGNQTAGFDKKGLQIKFDSKANLLGLNGGKKFKKWILLADAKDTTISRTALGLSMSKGIIAADSNVWSSDFTPVSVYLNNQYWGLYYLAEQKEVKKGRIKLDEPEDADGNPITSTEIGYCFELDHYAEDEPKKPDGGDPTFTLDYGQSFTRNSYSIENTLANFGPTTTYTMNSDITDSTAGENQAVNASNSNQVKFIRNRLQALFTVLHQAAVNKSARDIDANNNIITTNKTVRQVIEANFDLNAWAEGFIINAVCCPPDVGYSSFYMSFDNTPNGDKKLRFDNPWDFDSNFGNRSNFIESADSRSGNFDPYYMDRTANMWLQYLSKLDFFINDYVKPKWNLARENKVFEGMLKRLNVYYKFYEGEHQKNFAKWPTIDPSDPNVSSYFGGELRQVFKQVSNRKNAQKETINWLTKRVNYLEGKWGNNRPGVTAAE